MKSLLSATQPIALALMFIIGMILLTAEAQANAIDDCNTDTECEAAWKDYRVGIMPSSHHFNDRNIDSSGGEDWNEDHKGVFVEYRIHAAHTVGVMVYDNSIDNTTVTVYGTNDEYFRDGDIVDFGLVWGAATGYDIPVVPYVLPTMTVNLTDTFKSRVIAFPIGIAAQFYVEF